MEGTFFKEGMPKFKSPEEELDYLRAQVSRRERELSREGNINSNEHAIKEVIGEYKEVPSGDALHKDLSLSEKENEGIVLKLKPESHDTIMEELLGIVITKGIRNALSIVEKMNNPHVDDDFHRILIQFFKTEQSVNLNESASLKKAIDMTLFEITLPPATDEGEKAKGFKDFIGAMEQF